MDQLGPHDITFTTADIDSLGFPSPEDHITASSGHVLQAEPLVSHARFDSALNNTDNSFRYSNHVLTFFLKEMLHYD